MSSSRRNTVLVIAGLVALGAGGTTWYVAHKPAAKSANVAQPVTPTTAASTDPTPPAGATSTGASPTVTPATDASSSGAAGGPGAPGAYAADDTTALSTYPSLAGVVTAFGNAKHVKTTIDPHYQQAAAAALGTYPNAAMVVVQPSTGHILAIAERGISALQSELAPGSTFKVITTEDLLRNGFTANTSMPCTASVPGYKEVKNDSPSLTNTKANLTYAFTQSCNTSYVNKLDAIANTPLHAESTTYFGLNQPWDLGFGPHTYGTQGSDNVPSATGGPFAQEMFGQGPITVSPLIMASVAATAESGQFRQPVLVDGVQDKASATRLNSGVDATLKHLMQLTVTEGTATSLKGVGGGIGAKTGTAEPGNGGPNNSWMIAFRGDVAVACVVQGGNFGDESAGPAIATLFKTVGTN